MKYLIMLFLCAISICSFAQQQFNTGTVPILTDAPETDGGTSFSPSIVSFRKDDVEQLVCAYVFKRKFGETDSARHRTVGFQRSTDNGATWTRIKLSGVDVVLNPNNFTPSGQNGIKNLDEPQLLHVGGDTLLLVVRGHGDGGEGFQYIEQAKTVKTTSGIFLLQSTNLGQNWSTPVALHDMTFEGDNPSGTEFMTYESPKVAYRPEFDQFAYVTFTKKYFSKCNDNITVVASRVAIRAISLPPNRPASTQPDAFGAVLVPEFGSTYFIKRDNTNADESFGVGPERGSVAVSPDSLVWISYFSAKYGSTNCSSTTDADIYNGTDAPPAKWAVNQAKCTLVGTAKEARFTYQNRVVINPSDNFGTFGLYDKKRGYALFNTKTKSGVTHAIYNDLIDLAQGPSIQVAVNDPLSCKYSVGVVFVRNNSTNFSSAQTNNTRLSFHSASVRHFATPGNWLANRKTQTAAGLTVDAEGNSNFLFRRFFPVLKYTQVSHEEDWLRYRTFDTAINSNTLPYANLWTGMPRSFFTLCYMRYVQDQGNWSDSHVAMADSAACKCGVSYNNEDFVVSFLDPVLGETSMTTIRDPNSDSPQPSNQMYKADYWGSQIDVVGNYGKFDVHAVWHSINDMTTGFGNEGLFTSRGGCILAMPYLFGHLQNDPEAFPTVSSTTIVSGQPVAHRFFETDQDGGATRKWGPYFYFNFLGGAGDEDLDDQPRQITAVSTYSPVIHLGLPTSGSITFTNPATQTNGKSFHEFNTQTDLVPAVTTNPPTPLDDLIKPGIYYAFYRQAPFTFGKLNFSDQRKLVTTGHNLHGVFERDGKVFYSMTKDPESLTWMEPTQLSTFSSDVPQFRPSIAMYERGDGKGCGGEAAVAVTWTEIQPVDAETKEARIIMRTREFDLCLGVWGAWSPEYVVHKHNFPVSLPPHPLADPETNYGEDDNTTAVIAPLVRDQGSTPAVGEIDKTFLLGWTVTWSSPKLKVLSGVAQVDLAEPIPGVCQKRKQSGLYSRTVLRRTTAPGNSHAMRFSHEDWGLAKFVSQSTFNGATYEGIQPKHNNPTGPWNVLQTATPCNAMNPISFPTVVSNENKNCSTCLDQEVAYTTDGVAITSPGVWAFNVDYDNSTGINVGKKTGQTTETDLDIRTLASNETITDWKSRNPNIVINSSGQKFIAWERMLSGFFDEMEFDHLGNPIFFSVPFMKSEIPLARTFFNNGAQSDWTNAGAKDVITLYTKSARSLAFEWLRNPSLSAFPKSRLLNTFTVDPDPTPDLDPASVQLIFWNEHNDVWPQMPSKVRVDEIHFANYCEPRGTNNGATGSWNGTNTMSPASLLGTGIWPHRSFGLYAAGPRFFTNGMLPSGRQSYGLFNNPAENAILSGHLGAYKGTLDSMNGISLYRSEMRTKGSSWAQFIWGNVRVGDTASSLPMRTVKLHTGAYSPADHKQMRDTLFRTEIFDWPSGTEIQIYRGIYTSDSLAKQPGGNFWTPDFGMTYQIDLVDLTAQTTTTLETVEFKPYYGKRVIPMNLKLTNNDGLSHEVYIRVTGTVVGVDSASDQVTFHDEIMQGSYPVFKDSIVFKRAYPIKPDASGFTVTAPYPDPLRSGVHPTFQVMVHTRTQGTVNITVLNSIGQILHTTSSTQQGWSKISLPSPAASGVYFIQCQYGNEIVVKPLRITE